MRSESYGLCACLSVKSHLTSAAYVRPENVVTLRTCGVFSESAPLQRSSIYLRCTASVQCEGTHSLGIGFSRFKKANNRPKATWNTSQCETATYLSLSAALLSVSCLAIFRHVILSVFCLATFRIPPLHVQFISACAIVLFSACMHTGIARAEGLLFIIHVGVKNATFDPVGSLRVTGFISTLNNVCSKKILKKL